MAFSLPWSRRGHTVVFLGKRGVGKSSTLNYLFQFTRPTDAAAECTVEPYARWISSEAGRRYRIVDMPGIAADIDSNQRYGRHYRRWLGRADTVVWITQADVRAYKQDQLFFQSYSRFVSSAARLVLALSKVDTQVESLEAAEDAMDIELLRRKARDMSAEILPYTWASPETVAIVPYSIVKKWNTEQLRSAVLAASQYEEKWDYSGLYAAGEAGLWIRCALSWALIGLIRWCREDGIPG